MSGLWEDIKNAYFSYNGMGTNVFFLFVAIFYFLIINKKRQDLEELLVEEKKERRFDTIRVKKQIVSISQAIKYNGVNPYWQILDN